jgi:hypothetical protein
MNGKGASGRLPVLSRNPSITIVPAPPQAAAQVKPIPMAPRARLNHFFMSSSVPLGCVAPASTNLRSTLSCKVPVRIVLGKKPVDEA